MIQINETTAIFEDEEIELRKKLIQRAINIMLEPNKFDQFTREMDEFLARYESFNTDVRELNLGYQIK